MTTLPTTITTPRLVLRWWEDSDAPALVDVVAASLDHLRPMDAVGGVRADVSGSARRAVP